MSELAKRLKAVDPHLTVISRHRNKKKREMDEKDWGKAQGETCSRCGKEKLMIFDHPLGRVCKECYLWLQDNYIDEGERVRAKLLDDGRIILFREQGQKG